MSMIWVILCSLVKEIHRWQSASLVLSHKSQATRNRVWLFLPRPLISAQAPLSTPFPVVPARATTFVLVHCYLTWRIQTIVYFALGTNHRFAKVSLRLLCWHYNPSKTPSFLRPPLPSRWMRCDTNFSNFGFDVDWGFEEKLPSRQRADCRMSKLRNTFGAHGF